MGRYTQRDESVVFSIQALAVQSRCAVEENLWAKRDAVVILLGRAFPSAGAQEARS